MAEFSVPAAAWPLQLQQLVLPFCLYVMTAVFLPVRTGLSRSHTLLSHFSTPVRAEQWLQCLHDLFCNK